MMVQMNLYTVMFEDGTTTETTTDSSWYPRPIGTPMVEDPEKDAELFMTVGILHPSFIEANAMRFIPTAEADAARESCEVVGMRVMEF